MIIGRFNGRAGYYNAEWENYAQESHEVAKECVENLVITIWRNGQHSLNQFPPNYYYAGKTNYIDLQNFFRNIAQSRIYSCSATESDAK